MDGSRADTVSSGLVQEETANMMTAESGANSLVKLFSSNVMNLVYSHTMAILLNLTCASADSATISLALPVHSIVRVEESTE